MHLCSSADSSQLLAHIVPHCGLLLFGNHQVAVDYLLPPRSPPTPTPSFVDVGGRSSSPTYHLTGRFVFGSNICCLILLGVCLLLTLSLFAQYQLGGLSPAITITTQAIHFTAESLNLFLQNFSCPLFFAIPLFPFFKEFYLLGHRYSC